MFIAGYREHNKAGHYSPIEQQQTTEGESYSTGLAAYLSNNYNYYIY
jgi:hypothetical protein